MTLYKHLVYVDFVCFIRYSWNCYLKDTWEIFPTLDTAKDSWIGYPLQRGIRFSLRNYFTTILHEDVSVYYSKTKDFMFQRLIWVLSIGRHLLLNVLFQKKFKRGCGLKTYSFEKTLEFLNFSPHPWKF